MVTGGALESTDLTGFAIAEVVTFSVLLDAEDEAAAGVVCTEGVLNSGGLVYKKYQKC